MGDARIPYVDGRRLEALFIPYRSTKAAIIIIHEVWGLTSHIEAVCKRLSGLQFAVIAPNLYAHDRDLFTLRNIREAMRQVWDLPLAERYNQVRVARLLTRKRASPQTFRLLAQLYDRRTRARMLEELTSWARYALSRYRHVAVIGFSMGGGLSFKLTARCPRLRSCVSFCGEPPTQQELKRIDAPMLAICAGRDDFMNSGVPDFVREALRQRKNLIVKVYGNAKHEFFNPTNADYAAADADDAWNTAVDFLGLTLLNRISPRWIPPQIK